MNPYRQLMEEITPPAGQKQRLQAAVLAAAPLRRPRRYRPRSLAAKALLAAALLALLTVTAGAGAALVPWDAILAERFLPGAESSPAAQDVFQSTAVVSVCDDVTLTLRQALADQRTLYLLLDYRLPPDVDLDAVQAAWEAGTGPAAPIGVYAGEARWEDARGLEETAIRANLLDGERTSSSMTQTVGFDRESRTLSYLLIASFRESARPGQPLTLLTEGPSLIAGGIYENLAAHPALLSFTPTYTAESRKGGKAADGLRCQVELTPLTLFVEVASAAAVPSGEQLAGEAVLVYTDGSERPANDLAASDGSSTGASHSSGGGRTSYTASCTILLEEILDTSQISALRLGDLTIPLR